MSALIIKDPQELKAWRKNQSKIIGFIPTMGALHEGHEELLKQSRLENEVTVLSIFTNPTQFNDKKDLLNYPKTWDKDLEMANRNQVDVIFYPEYSQIYPDNYTYKVIETDFSRKLCGKSREGHFDGVLTVVMKLFNLVQPHRAYFGEKDFQQLTLIKNMVDAFFMNIEIMAVKTVREKSGLAKSSRNTLLSKQELELAPQIHQSLTRLQTSNEVLNYLQQLGLKVDYVEDVNNRRYVAAFLGNVRLIDNVEL